MNGFEKFFVGIGHELKVIFTDGKVVAEKLPEYIQATEIALKEGPTIVSDVTAVVEAAAGGTAIVKATLTAVESLGLNPEADIAAIQALVAEATNAKTYVLNLEAAVTKLCTTLGATEAQIAAALNPASAPDAPESIQEITDANALKGAE